MEQPQEKMNGTSHERQHRDSIRKYLLGILDDTVKMRQIEEKILLDESYAERLAIAEDELIEEYLDGTLTEAEREQFVRFFLVTSENKRKLRLVENLRKYAAKSDTQAIKKPLKEKSRFFDWQSLYASSMPALRFAVVALVLCSIVFAVWRLGFYESGADRGLAELRKVYSNGRPFESRVSNFDYAPFSTTRGSDNQAAESRLRDSAALKLLDAAQSEPGTKSFHALGNYYLTEKQFEKAISQFDAALDLDPNNAQLHNDYGVALLEKAKQISMTEQPGKRLENLARAFEHFNKAIELNSSLHEALFNRAIALQQMNSSEQARRAWLDYLEKDSSSPWAEEARKNLQQTEIQTISSAKTPEQVLADFFEAFERRDDERAWQIVSQTREMITSTMFFFAGSNGRHQIFDRIADDAKIELISLGTPINGIKLNDDGDFDRKKGVDFVTITNLCEQLIPEPQSDFGKYYEVLEFQDNLIYDFKSRAAITPLTDSRPAICEFTLLSKTKTLTDFFSDTHA